MQPPAHSTATPRDIAPATTRDPLRVCVVAPSMDFLGGQAIQAQRLLAHLREEPGLEVGFIPHVPRLRGRLRRLQTIRYLRTLVSTPMYVALLLAELRRYDVIHVFSAAYWSYFLQPMLAILIGRLYGKQVILNYRSGELEDHLQRWRSAVATMRLASAIVAPSPYLIDVFARFGLTARTIPNYLDDEHLAYRRREPLRPVFLVNRSFEPLYNYPVVLRAFALVQREVPNARLIVAGDGPLRETIRSLIGELGLRHVDFRGRVTHRQMLALYHEADIYLNGPDLDCLPGSVLEAFAAGAAVVTTNAGGLRYLVRHEETGLLSECGDAEGLARNALRLLTDPALARRLAENAWTDLQATYVWSAVRPLWLELYAALTRRDVAPPEIGIPRSPATHELECPSPG